MQDETPQDDEEVYLGSHRKSTLQRFSKEVFISSFEIIDFKVFGGHVNYIIRVRGRTKYLVNVRDLADIGLLSKTQLNLDEKMQEIRRSTLGDLDPSMANQQSVEYNIVKRYSELLTFSKVLQQEMKNYMRKNGITTFPEFPKKKFFFAKTKPFIDARIKKINTYF